MKYFIVFCLVFVTLHIIDFIHMYITGDVTDLVLKLILFFAWIIVTMVTVVIHKMRWFDND